MVYMVDSVELKKGENLTEDNLKKNIILRATEKVQGAFAIVTKSDGSTVEVFLFIDNGRCLYKEAGSVKNWEDFEVVKFT